MSHDPCRTDQLLATLRKKPLHVITLAQVSGLIQNYPKGCPNHPGGWGGGGTAATEQFATTVSRMEPSGGSLCQQWRIQDFPEEGALTPKGGMPTYYLANFSRKLHENEEILGQRGGASLAHTPPPRSATGQLSDETSHSGDFFLF